jgi:hypothetical protein
VPWPRGGPSRTPWTTSAPPHELRDLVGRGQHPSAAKGHDREDYFVWVITGTQDFAQPFDQDRVKLMRSSPFFVEASSEQDGNFTFRLKGHYGHDGRSATEYTYNRLRSFWGT